MGALPGIFERTIFSPTTRLALLNRDALYIRAPHPKTEIAATRAAIEKVLASGWVGQIKIHGHRAQIHLSADPNEAPVAYNRQGRPHATELSAPIVAELRRLFAPREGEGWSAIDAEWIKGEDKLYVFDFLKKDGVTLSRLGFAARHKLLPTGFISPYFQVLPLITNASRCLEALADPSESIEGLVFKSPTTVGFPDTAVLRCRKPGSRA